MKLSTQAGSQQAGTRIAGNQEMKQPMKALRSMRWLLLFLLMGATAANAQVSVTATAGTVGPTSYTTVKLAFDAINAGTHQGAITIGISANTTEGTTPATLNSSGAGSASYTSVSIRPTADGVSVSGNPITGFGVIQLNGADNVTIDGDNAGSAGTNRNLTINNTTTATVIANSCIRIATSANVTSADNNTIKNCILNGNVSGGNSSLITSTTGSSNSSFGIYCGGNGGATATGAPTAISSVTTNVAPTGTTINTLLIDNNAVTNCARAIVYNGNVATVCPGTLTITNNLIGTAGSLSGTPPFTTPASTVYTKGIWVNGVTSLNISNNTIRNILSYVTTPMNAIELVGAIGGVGGTTTINGNNINGVVHNGAGTTVNAILVSANSNVYTISKDTIQNIQNVGTSSIVGINIASSSATSGTIDKNLISTIITRNTGGYAAKGILMASGNAVKVQNNMIWDLNAVASNSTTSTSFGVFGIQFTGGINHAALHNSVNLNNTFLAGGSAADPSACLSISATTITGMDVRNNIFSNTMSGGNSSVNACLQIPSGGTSAMQLLLDNNAYYTGSGALNYLAITASTLNTFTAANFNAAATTPSTNWRSYSTTLNSVALGDASSFATTAAAPFISATNLHLDPASGQVANVEQKGTIGLGVATDIDGDARPNVSTTFPDMGADEIAVAVCSSAVGGTITPGTVNKCVGQTYTMSSAGATTGSGITYQWEVSTVGGGLGFGSVSGGSGANTTSYTTGTLTSGIYYYRLKTTCSAGPTGTSNELVLTVNILPTVTVSPTSSTICQPGASAVTLTAGGASTYSWNPTTGLTPTSGSPVAALPTTTTIYTVTGTDANGCTGTATSTITVGTTPTVAATATPANVCSGNNSQLLANAYQAFTTSTASLYTLNGTSVTYTPIRGTTLGTNAIGDDVGIGNLPIGFTFNYNGSNHTIFGARSNGLIELDQASTSALSGFSSNALASTANCIAPLWDDNNTTGGSIIYATTGAVGFRVLTVQWTGMHVGNGGSATQPTIDMQVKLYEGTNKIEFIYGSTSAAFTTTTASIGLSGASGNFLSVTPLNPVNTTSTNNASENTGISSAANFPSGTKYTFTSAGSPVLTYLWSPTTFLPGGSETTANPIATAVTATTVYTVTVSAGGCSAQGSATVTVSPLTAGSITTSGSFCAGSALTATANTTGGSPAYNYAWSDDVSTIYPNSQTVNINLAAGAHTLNVTVTDACGGSVPMTLPVTINPLPAVAVVSGGGTFCTSTTITAANGNDGTMYFQGTTSNGTSTATASASQVVSASGTYYFRAQSAAGCWGPQGSVVVTIQTPASITTTAATVCQGGAGTIAATSGTGCVTFVSSGTSIPGTWNAATDPVVKRPISSISNSATCSFDLSVTRNYVAQQFQVTTTGTYIFEMDNNTGYDGMGYIVSGAFTPGTCGAGTWIRGDDDNGSGSSEPKLGAVGIGDGAMTLTAGVTYTLVSTTYSSSSGTFSGSFNWTVTPPSGAQVMLAAAGNIQWYTSPTGGTAFGTGSPFNPVGVLNSGLPNTNTAGTTVFYAACSNSSACRTPVNFVINGISTISLSSVAGTDAQTVCTNTAIAPITYTVGGAATSASITSGSLPAGVSGSYSAGVFTISGTPTAAGNFSYVITTSGSSCTEVIASGSITVNPASTITLTTGAPSAAQTVCINNAISPISYTVAGGATGASITSGSLPAGVNGVFSAGVFTISGTATAAGSFSYTITTSGGSCGNATASGTITVNDASTITLTSATGTNNQTVCNNATIAPITYAIAGGGTGASITSGSLPPGVTGSYSAGVFTISGAATASGSYLYTITTSGGSCGQSTASGAITVNGSLAATFTKTNLSACSFTNDGSITVSPTGGSGSYTYSWTGATGSGNPAPQNFTAGNVNPLTGLNYGYYNVTITDNGGCGSITIPNIHVEFAYNVYITNSGTNANACGGSTGSIILYGNGGVQPYTYKLDAAPYLSYQPGNTFTGLPAGTYLATVKDAAGCIQTKSITVGAAAAIVVSPFVRNASSCSPDGSIEVYRSGGTPPYTYSKDGTNYQPGNVFSALAAGSYTVYVKDAAGCVGSAPATVAAGVGLAATTSKVNTSSCINDGSIQVNASGGTAPYTYSKDNGTTYQPSNSFSALGAGNYAIKVKDSKGCTSGTINVTINLNNIVVTASAVNASSCASSNGSIQLFRTGGVGPYTYSLEDAVTNATFGPSSSPVFAGLPAGTYNGYVQDSKGCTAVLNSIVVGPSCPAPPVATNKSLGNNAQVSTAKVPVSNMLKVQAYPNPTATAFTLVLEGFSNDKVSITVTDIMGRKVYQAEGNGKQQFRFGSLFIAGIYNVQVVQADKKQSIKLVKE